MFACRRGSMLYGLLLATTFAAVGGLAAARRLLGTGDADGPGTARPGADGVHVVATQVNPQGTSITREANTTGNTRTFSVLNTGPGTHSYTFYCANTGAITCTNVSPASKTLGPGSAASVTVTFSVGAPGTGTLRLWAEATSNAGSGYYNVTIVQHGVSVTPDDATAPRRDGNTPGYTESFTVQNTGGVLDTFALTCTGLGGVTCTTLSASSVILAANASQTVTATYDMGTADGTLRLTASDASGKSDIGSYTVPVALYGVAVTPDGGSVSGLREANKSYQEQFTVENTGNIPYTYTLTCSGSSHITCNPVNLGTLTLDPGVPTPVTVNYLTGATGTDTLRLTATSAKASDGSSYVFPIIILTPQAPVVATDSANPGITVERDLCLTVRLTAAAAAECGDLRVTHALPATRTMNKVRAPTLIYNHQQGTPYPLVRADVTLPGTATIPDSVVMRWWTCLGATCTYRTSGKWNGSDWVQGATRRVTLGYDAANDATNLYRDSLEVVNWYGNTPYVAPVGTPRVLVNRRSSPFGVGWWLAGLERLYPDTKLWVGGDGSARQYTPAGTDVWVAPSVDYPDTLKYFPGQSEYVRYLPGRVQVVFNAAGRHVRTVNRLGHVTTFTYDASNRLSSLTLPPSGAGKTYTFTYGTNLVTITAPPVGATSRVTTLTLSSGRILQITDPDQTTVSFSYGASFGSYRMGGRTNRRGVVDSYHYDAAWRVSSGGTNIPGTDPIVSLTNAETAGLAGTAAVDPAQISTLINGLRTDVSDTTRVWVNRYGAPRKIRNALGYVTQLFRRDTRWPGLVTQVIYPNGRNVAGYYDQRGHLDSLTDSSSYDPARNKYATTKYQWNMSCDAVTRVTQPEGDYVELGYDAATCNRLWQQDARGSTSRVNFVYHTTSQLVTKIDRPLSGDELFAYDSSGTTATWNLLGASTGRGHWTRYFPDAVGRDTLIMSPVDSTDQALVSSTSLNDTLRVRQRRHYDIMGRVLADTTIGAKRDVVAALGTTGIDTTLVHSTYDAEGLPLTVSRRSGPDTVNAIGWATTQWQYDALGRKIAEIAPDGMVDSMFYDLTGNLTTLRTRRGHRLEYRYDELNRLTRRITPEVTYAQESINPYQPRTVPRRPNNGTSYTVWADTATFTYDSVGNLLTANNRDARITRTYTARGLPSSDTLRIRTWSEPGAGGNFDAHVYGVQHGYDLNGRRIWIKHPATIAPQVGGVIKDSVAYDFDDVTGFLTSVREPLGNVIRFTYDAEGRPDSTLYPGNLKEKVAAYDANGLPARRIEVNQSGLSGNVAFPVATLRDENFARDAVARVARMINTGGYQDTLWLTYTSLGSLLSSTHSQRKDPAQPPGSGIWTSYQETFTWDALGNRKRSYSVAYQFPENDPDNRFGLGGSGPTIARYQAGTGRLTSHDVNGDSLTYDQAGNLAVKWLYSPNPGAWLQARSYYGADQKLRMYDSFAGAVAPNLSQVAMTQVVEEYRYDALGRRVLARTYNSCGDVADLGCKFLIRRTVWDGDHELYEIQYRVDSISAASLEVDTGVLAADSGFYGRVAYVHAGGIDRPVALVRSDYRQSYNGSYSTLAPMAVALHYGFRGIMDWGSFDNGAMKRCIVPSDAASCITPSSPSTQKAFKPGSERLADWWGTLQMGKADGTGLMYRRNRYYDPSAGRFTQEDPIGLAGGLNAYGYAGGDPVNYADPFGLFELSFFSTWLDVRYRDEQTRRQVEELRKKSATFDKAMSRLEGDPTVLVTIGQQDIMPEECGLTPGCVQPGVPRKGTKESPFHITVTVSELVRRTTEQVLGVSSPMGAVLAHEIYGHAVPLADGWICSDAGEPNSCAVKRENVIRQEAGMAPRKF